MLEIGPNQGLDKGARLHAARVSAVEIDNRLLPVQVKPLQIVNTHVIHGDAMEIDLHKLIKDEFGNLKVAVCANLPYYNLPCLCGS